MNIIRGLTAYSKAKDAAAANHIGGWLGTGLAAGCGALIAGGYVEQFRDFVCKASADDIGLAVATIGVAASLLNSGSTKALTPKQDAPEAESVATVRDLRATDPSQADTQPRNSDLERSKMPFPTARRR